MPLIKSFLPREVFITSMARTPIGKFLGGLSPITATQLGSTAISAAIERSHLNPNEIDGVVMGHVLKSGCRQSTTRQAALEAGIPPSVDVYGVDKVCASGLKSICLAAQAIALQQNEIVVAGGMESMSNSPYLLGKARTGGYKFGNGELIDTLTHDGLTDAYNHQSMGWCAEKTAKEFNLDRTVLDKFAVQSYKRSADAWKTNIMKNQICTVKVPTGKPSTSMEQPYIYIEEDEQYSTLKLDKMAKLSPVFTKYGVLTAANSSPLSDGAAAVVLMSKEKLKQIGVKPLAKIISFADAAVEPTDFSLAPFHSFQKAKKFAKIDRVHLHEINEAFSSVVIANMKLLNLDISEVNVCGGAISLGHPLGMSGTRIVISLISSLHTHMSTHTHQLGAASICNGGGGATSIIIEAC